MTGPIRRAGAAEAGMTGPIRPAGAVARPTAPGGVPDRRHRGPLCAQAVPRAHGTGPAG